MGQASLQIFVQGIIGAADHDGKLDIRSTNAKSLINCDCIMKSDSLKMFQVERANFLRYWGLLDMRRHDLSVYIV